MKGEIQYKGLLQQQPQEDILNKELMRSERIKLVKIMSKNYMNANKKDKGFILDSLIRITGYSRKYASALLIKSTQTVKLTGSGFLLKADPGKRSSRKRAKIYGEEVQRILLFLWRTFDYPCSQRLQAMLPYQLPKMEQFWTLHASDWKDRAINLNGDIKALLLNMSRSTIERILGVERRKYQLKGISHTKPGSLLKHQIPIRTFAEWNEHQPGFTEIDLVGHEGGFSCGEFCLSLNMTDIHTGWTETQGVRNKAQVHVFKAFQELRARLPFPLKGIDSDNGSEFINNHMLRYCEQEQLSFTRGRKNYKNDQCYIEQKNWSIVRKYAGYARYDSEEELLILNELYQQLRLFTNYFLPGMQLQEKLRIGAQVKKRYDTPRTPFQRVLESPIVSIQDKEALMKTYEYLNPFELKRKIKYLQTRLREVRRKKELDVLTCEDKLKPTNFRKEKLDEEMNETFHPHF